MHYYTQVELKEVPSTTYFKTSGISLSFYFICFSRNCKLRLQPFYKIQENEISQRKMKDFLRHLLNSVMCISTFNKQVTSQCLPLMGRHYNIQTKTFIFAFGRKFCLKSIIFLESVGSGSIKRIV